MPSCFGLIVNTISVFSVKELPEDKLTDENPVEKEAAKFSSDSYPDFELSENACPKEKKEEKYCFVKAMKMLFTNKFYIMISRIAPLS